MSEYTEGLAALEQAEHDRKLKRERRSREFLRRETLLASELRPGDKVVDKISGGLGIVERVSFENIVIPPAG